MVTALEPVIDDVTTRFDPPQEFVLRGENELAAALDLARAVVRRAERQAVGARDAGWPHDSQVVPHLNRLADLVYTLARWQEHGFRPVRSDGRSRTRPGGARVAHVHPFCFAGRSRPGRPARPARRR